jgi:hypothetical protein
MEINKTEAAKLRKILATYLMEIHKRYHEGDLREESFYSTVEKLFEAVSPLLLSEEEIEIRILPKGTKVGVPDFRIRKNGEIIGHIEAKPPDTNLQDIERSEQIERYRDALPNLILTNLLEFLLYRNGVLVDKVNLCSPIALRGSKPPVPEDAEAFFRLISEFHSFSTPEIRSASDLAMVLAKKTRFSQSILKEVLVQEKEPGYPFPLVKGFYEIFRDTLIADLTEERFVDLYAQTITYGLFAAKMVAKEQEIHKDNAWRFIPHGVPLLPKIFYSFSGPNTPEPLSWVIDDIVRVLNNTDIAAVQSEIRETHRLIDPIIHFYETFLATYNPEERERLGVYYTPLPVVSYIVRSIHGLLKETFGKDKGLAEDDVMLLDPAAGTLTFVIRALREALSELRNRGLEGLVPSYIERHILLHFYAFELLIVPYIIGHLRVSTVLEREWNYTFEEHERFRFYLTNTLEMGTPKQAALLPELTQEGQEAKKVKEEVPILVVLGNPPYSGISENKGKWITDLIEDYKYVDGKHFGEKKHWLQDDYVKFIRFGQWKIDRTGEGVLGFITNHSYLDNPTFRGMRQSLMKSFDEIYVLNLHGSSLKKEKCPNGSKDENVFDIRQGVAISLFVKKKGEGVRNARVYYAERWGLREEKYKWLQRNDRTTTEWHELQPKTPFYFFVPMEELLRDVYDNYWKITDIFTVGVTGIVTARDNFVIDFDKVALRRRIEMFRDLSIPDENIKQTFQLEDTRGWKFTEARKTLAKDENWGMCFTKILYRPFDIRDIYYTPKMIDWPRPEVMRHMMHENLGLITPREFKEEPGAFVTEQITGHKTVSAYDINYIYPLYLYPDESKGRLPEEKTSKPERTPNFSPAFLHAVQEALGAEPTSEEIFYYMYAVLYSPTYRKRYAEFLKIDFPRIPLPNDYEQFKRLSELGSELVELHLLKHHSLAKPGVGFPVGDSNTVEKVRYDEENERVYFNKTQYFEGVPKAVWAYQIGGYQVMAKYLKDRKGRELSKGEIEHYMKVVKALKRTIEVQTEIDEVFL